MKILHITSLGYVGGGVENGILLMDPVLEGLGHTVKVFASDHNPSVPHFSDYEFPALSQQPMPLKLFYRALYPHAYFALRRVLREFQPDVVQVHSLFEVSPSVFFALRNYPTIVMVHGAEDYTPELLLWAFPLRFFKHPDTFTLDNLTLFGKLHYWYHRYVSMPVYRYAFRAVDRFVVFSEYMRAMMRRQGIESVCVPNATELYAPAPYDEHGATLLYVGRLEKIKGVHHLIEALSTVREKHPHARLVVVGTGEYETELRALVAQHGLTDHVTFAGQKSREELYEYYKDATLVVVPSVWPEPFGKVGIEAYSVGRPVVACDVGGISEWLTDGETGFLVAPEAPSELAEKICRLFGNPPLLHAMSQRAVERVQEFSIQTHTARMLAIYEEVRKNHASLKAL